MANETYNASLRKLLLYPLYYMPINSSIVVLERLKKSAKANVPMYEIYRGYVVVKVCTLENTNTLF